MEASARTLKNVHASEKCEEDDEHVHVHGTMEVLITFECESPTCTRKNSNMSVFEETYRMRETQHKNERT
jgi:hypothetical protein